MPTTRTPAADLTLHGARTFEPPYDDESAEAVALTSGSLALDLSLGGSEHEVPSLRLLPGGRAEPVLRGAAKAAPNRQRSRGGEQTPATAPVPEEQVDEEQVDEEQVDAVFAARRTPRCELPPPRAFGARLVQALSEATAGERPLAQLSPYLSRGVYQRLERHFAGTVRGSTGGQDNRANVASVRVCEPSDGVAELAAVVRRGGRMAAVALRLEGVDGRWQCTALQIG
jgi:hypothetical protein